MKKPVLTLLVLLVCAIQPSTAYEYFTIYFCDGTKSEAFYATDVDSICYSKLSLDSIAYDDWQVQEIYTCDSVYRYPLAQIDSLSFKDVDVNRVAEDIAQVSSNINPLFLQCNSSEELYLKIQGITNMDYIEKVWIDNLSLHVKIRDYGIISFSYPPHGTPNLNLSVPSRNAVRQSMNTNKANEDIIHKHVDVRNVCVVRQMTKDMKHKDGIAESDSIIKRCREWGLNVIVNDEPRPEFFVDGIRKYDLVFLMTHGSYNGSHWLATSEEIYTQTLNRPVNVDSLNKVAREFIKTKYLDKGYSPNDVSSGRLIENRNGVKTLVNYTWVSNRFILKHNTPKSNNIVVFNTACQSMMDNPELADAFINKGLCYAGFTESNTIGPWTNRALCERLLSGFSVFSAYHTLPDVYYQEKIEVPKGSGNIVNPKLILWPEKRQKELTSVCFTHPETLPLDIESNSGDTIVKLKAYLKTLDPGMVLVENGGYGFQYSEDPYFSDYQTIGNDLLGYVNHEKSTKQFSFETDNIANLLQPNTTYYYRAYMYDGISYCYGEVQQFTTQSEREPYAVLNDSTLTFYYDNHKKDRVGTIYPIINKSYASWHDNPSWAALKISKVVFHPAFVDYTPLGTAEWFKDCGNLKIIENLQYLNTANVTNMCGMFDGCSSLTSLDLSSFNTANVTDMNGIFMHCSSLTSLDMSNFNTANVKDMSLMFENCSSLTNIDLSSFNTANVMYMRAMFRNCSSLTSLDLSNFNTAKVRDMVFMFSGCCALESLDLSSFNTANVTSMMRMFYDCRSLESLDLSSFNTANVKYMNEMFSGCDSLVSIDARNFVIDNSDFSVRGLKNLKHLNLCNVNTTNVTNMSGMFYGCSSLTSLDLSSFNTANVTNMQDMFDGCRSLESLDLSSFNTANVTSMMRMFYGCRSLESLDLSNFNTANVTNMQDMFYGCRSLESLDLSNFNTANVTNMQDMFDGCSSLTSINFQNLVLVGDVGVSLFADLENLQYINLSNANTANVTSMRGMFYGCSSLTSLDLRSFNTVNVTDMSWMFCGCRSLESLDLSNFNTANVTNMIFMFSDCDSLVSIDARNFVLNNNTYRVFSDKSNLKYLNLSNVNTDNVTSMRGMFYGCSSLTSLDLRSFNTDNVTNMESMFEYCSSLKTIYAGNWAVKIGNFMFRGCNNLTGGKGTKIGNNLYGYNKYGQPLYYYCSGDGSAAHIDGGKDNPGLFTAK